MRSEEIIDAIVTRLTGLTTTGANAFRGLVYNLSDTQMPGLAISNGNDELTDELESSFYDWTLTVIIESKAQQPVGDPTHVGTVLSTIRNEVHQALVAAPIGLGLSFVIKIMPVSAGEPDYSGEGNQPIATQRLEYQVQYRTSQTDLAA